MAVTLISTIFWCAGIGFQFMLDNFSFASRDFARVLPYNMSSFRLPCSTIFLRANATGRTDAAGGNPLQSCTVCVVACDKECETVFVQIRTQFIFSLHLAFFVILFFQAPRCPRPERWVCRRRWPRCRRWADRLCRRRWPACHRCHRPWQPACRHRERVRTTGSDFRLMIIL